jgi:uncharacterized protein (TIGR03067 family)
LKFTYVAILVVAFGLIAAQEPKKDDSESLKGNWTAVSMKQNKQSLPEDFVKTFRLSMDGKNYTNTAGQEVMEEGGYTVDASKMPKTIDFDIKKGPDAGRKQLGLYKLEGDKLTIVVSPSDSTERPKSLEADDSNDAIVVVLERVKP